MQIKPKKNRKVFIERQAPGFLLLAVQTSAHRTITDINQHFLTFQSRGKNARKMEIAFASRQELSPPNKGK
jgi:hypothetical protein